MSICVGNVEQEIESHKLTRCSEAATKGFEATDEHGFSRIIK